MPGPESIGFYPVYSRKISSGGGKPLVDHRQITPIDRIRKPKTQTLKHDQTVAIRAELESLIQKRDSGARRGSSNIP